MTNANLIHHLIDAKFFEFDRLKVCCCIADDVEPYDDQKFKLVCEIVAARLRRIFRFAHFLAVRTCFPQAVLVYFTL